MDKIPTVRPKRCRLHSDGVKMAFLCCLSVNLFMIRHLSILLGRTEIVPAYLENNPAELVKWMRSKPPVLRTVNVL